MGKQRVSSRWLRVRVRVSWSGSARGRMGKRLNSRLWLRSVYSWNSSWAVVKERGARALRCAGVKQRKGKECRQQISRTKWTSTGEECLKEQSEQLGVHGEDRHKQFDQDKVQWH